MINYKRSLEIANKFLGEDEDPRLKSFNQQKTNLQNQNKQLQDKIKQNNLKIADIDKQIAQLGGSIDAPVKNGE